MSENLSFQKKGMKCPSCPSSDGFFPDSKIKWRS